MSGLIFDRALSRDLDGVVTMVFRYVDHYLVFGSETDTKAFTYRALEVFVSRGKGLKFTSETPVDEQMQFLDVLLKFEPADVCWSFSPRAGKRLLNYASDHCRLVKMAL